VDTFEMPPHVAQISERALLENRDFLRLLARKLVYDEHVADDVVQQAWLAALERPPRFQGPLKAWLAGVVRNLAFATLKREGERPARESWAARTESVDLDEEQDFDQQQLVMDSVHALRQPYRSTIYLRYYRELSPGEIAELQGIPVATVKTRLRRGLEQLRADLDHRHDCPRSRWCVALAPFAGLGSIAPPPGALSVTSVLKGLILMNKTVLATLSVVVISALASVAWIISRPPEGGGVPPAITAADPTSLEDEDLAAGGARLLVDDESTPAGERTALAAAPGSAASDSVRTEACVVGRVVDDLGHPISGADVVLFTSASPWGRTVGIDSLGVERESETQTDADGHFTLPRGEPGTANLAVGADGFAPFRKEIILGAEEVHDVDALTLDPGVFVSGRVIDTTGRAVAGAEIRRPLRTTHGEVVVLRGADPSPLVAVTDSAGRFSVARQAVGPWKLRIKSEDHPRKEIEGQTKRSGERVSSLVVTLAEGFQISGRVFDLPEERSDPLIVRATPLSEKDEGITGLRALSSLGSSTATVSPDGSFLLRGLRGECGYSLQLRAQSVFSSRNAGSAKVEARPGDSDITLIYSVPAALVFQVVDGQSGLPLTDFEVRTGSLLLSSHTEDGEIVEHHPEGRVRIEDFQRGAGLALDEQMKVEVNAVGYETFTRDDIAFSGDGDVDLGVFRLQRVPLVRVEVRDDRSGAPIEGATVTLVPEGQERTPGGRMMRIQLSAGDGEDPVIQTSGPQLNSGATDQNGLCMLNSLPGKAARVRVKTDDHAPYSSELLDLPNAGDFDHQVRLVEGSTLEVLVLDQEGQPSPGLRVQHEPPTDVPPAHADQDRRRVSDSEGRILFTHLEEGAHRFKLVESPFGDEGMPGRLVIGGPERGDDWQEVLIVPGDRASLTMIAAPRGDLEGVITEAGVLLAGATVRLLPPREDSDAPPLMTSGPSTTTDSKGRYSLDNQKAGDYRLEITHESRAMPWEEPFLLHSGRNRENFNLPVSIIEGRITDPTGKPIVGALVTAERSRGDEPEEPRVALTMFVISEGGGSGSTIMSVDGPGYPEVRTDEKGYYSLRGVRADWLLVVTATGEDFAREHSESLELTDGEVRRNVDLTVKPAGTIEITLRQPDGSPAGGFLVRGSYLADEEIKTSPSLAGPDGKVRLTGCLAGKWRVSFNAVSFTGDAVSEPPEPREIEVTAGETTTVDVTVP
jgi:RNA polymerase sigma factor (sigma-70 family)